VNTRHNLPIMLVHNDDGTVFAECLLLPGCKCFGQTRAQALDTIQVMVRSALRAGQRVALTNYEVVHLAVRAPQVAS